MADYDVIVIGGGAAGLSAALAAHDDGASVIVVEGQSELGGSTALSGGWFLAAGTSVQRAAGIVDDTPAGLVEYYLQVNQWRVDPALVRVLCEGAAPAVEWLISLGVEFPVRNLKRSGMETVARGHQPDGKGAEIAAALIRAVKARGIDVALGNRVESLAPVTARGATLDAAATVIATGGFGQNRALFARYYPDALHSTTSASAPGAQGDALMLGRAVGAAVTGHNRGLLIPAASLGGAVTMPAGWAMLVDRDGRRFIDEAAYYSVLSKAIIARGGECFAIFDDATRRGAPADPAFGDLLGEHEVTGAYMAGLTGRAWRAPNVALLAAHLGMPARILEATVAHAPENLALRVPPFYAVRVTPAIVALTACGLTIDAHARVLDDAGEPIPGLFAAGEATGSVLGELYIASGNSLANCVVYGRIAGHQAAHYAAHHPARRP